MAGFDARVCAVVDLALGGGGEGLVCILELAREVMIVNTSVKPSTSSTVFLLGWVRMVYWTGRSVWDLREGRGRGDLTSWNAAVAFTLSKFRSGWRRRASRL